MTCSLGVWADYVTVFCGVTRGAQQLFLNLGAHTPLCLTYLFGHIYYQELFHVFSKAVWLTACSWAISEGLGRQIPGQPSAAVLGLGWMCNQSLELHSCSLCLCLIGVCVKECSLMNKQGYPAVCDVPAQRWAIPRTSEFLFCLLFYLCDSLFWCFQQHFWMFKPISVCVPSRKISWCLGCVCAHSGNA